MNNMNLIYTDNVDIATLPYCECVSLVNSLGANCLASSLRQLKPLQGFQIVLTGEQVTIITTSSSNNCRSKIIKLI